MEEMLMEADETGVPLIIRVLSALFKRTVAKNDKRASDHWEQQDDWAKEAFDGLNYLKLPIEKFIYLIYAGMDCSPYCFMAAFIYIDRFLDIHPSIIIDSFNVHGIFIAAFLTAVKIFDIRCKGLNQYLANLASISIAELNIWEMELCLKMDFDLAITRDTYNYHCSKLINEMSSLSQSLN